MNWPFVSRTKLDEALQRIALLEAALQAKDELIELLKETRQEVKQDNEEMATRPRRIFGKDIAIRATSWATERAQKQGTTK